MATGQLADTPSRRLPTHRLVNLYTGQLVDVVDRLLYIMNLFIHQSR